jgi:hypothetical protein
MEDRRNYRVDRRKLFVAEMLSRNAARLQTHKKIVPNASALDPDTKTGVFFDCLTVPAILTTS